MGFQRPVFTFLKFNLENRYFKYQSVFFLDKGYSNLTNTHLDWKKEWNLYIYIYIILRDT